MNGNISYPNSSSTFIDTRRMNVVRFNLVLPWLPGKLIFPIVIHKSRCIKLERCEQKAFCTSQASFGVFLFFFLSFSLIFFRTSLRAKFSSQAFTLRERERLVESLPSVSVAAAWSTLYIDGIMQRYCDVSEKYLKSCFLLQFAMSIFSEKTYATSFVI